MNAEKRKQMVVLEQEHNKAQEFLKQNEYGDAHSCDVCEHHIIIESGWCGDAEYGCNHPDLGEIHGKIVVINLYYNGEGYTCNKFEMEKAYVEELKKVSAD